VVGAVFGYLLGQVVTYSIASLGLLGDLQLNYSSLSAVFSTMLVMAVVILSTIYPARMASRMSVPDVTRRWKFPDPEGDRWVFDFPFTVASRGVLGLYVFLNNYFESYKEESIGKFYADKVRLSDFDGEYGKGYKLHMVTWLAPFDMGVSQEVDLGAIPTEDEGITRIELEIRRLSGDVSSWRRLNRGFLTELRKQFLIWRTVGQEIKDQYAEEGQQYIETLHRGGVAHLGSETV
jgi:hypothetical protein